MSVSVFVSVSVSVPISVCRVSCVYKFQLLKQTKPSKKMRLGFECGLTFGIGVALVLVVIGCVDGLANVRPDLEAKFKELNEKFENRFGDIDALKDNRRRMKPAKNREEYLSSMLSQREGLLNRLSKHHPETAEDGQRTPSREEISKILAKRFASRNRFSSDPTDLPSDPFQKPSIHQELTPQERKIQAIRHRVSELRGRLDLENAAPNM